MEGGWERAEEKGVKVDSAAGGREKEKREREREREREGGREGGRERKGGEKARENPERQSSSRGNKVKDE